MALEHRNFGEFKVPGLRNVAHTAPYMHNGSLATLADVVRHYSELSPDRLHSDGESDPQAAAPEAGGVGRPGGVPRVADRDRERAAAQAADRALPLISRMRA